MRIGGHDLSSRVLIVAEIGNNHEGDPGRAEALVREAAACGADAVKLQTYRTRDFVRPWERARYDRLASFELAPDVVRRLAALARSLGVLFVSTPLDLSSADLLEPLVDAFKIASGDIDFAPLLRRVAASGKPVILSTGLSDLAEILRAKALLDQTWGERRAEPRLAILHCVSAYPVPHEEANLAALPCLASRVDCAVGYSDHTLGTDAAVAAVALGARIIEKHFTLDRNTSEFRDHKIASDPPELRKLVERVRRTERMLRAPGKSVQRCSQDLLVAARRSIVAARDLPVGSVLTGADLSWMRPADGLPPGAEGQLVGRRLRRDVRFAETLQTEDVD